MRKGRDHGLLALLTCSGLLGGDEIHAQISLGALRQKQCSNCVLKSRVQSVDHFCKPHPFAVLDSLSLQ